MKKPAKLVWIVLVLSMVGIIGSWIYVPAVKVVTYQALFAIGPKSVRLWVVDQLPELKNRAYPLARLATYDKNSEVKEKAKFVAGQLGFTICVQYSFLLKDGRLAIGTKSRFLTPKEWQAKREKQRQTGR